GHAGRGGGSLAQRVRGVPGELSRSASLAVPTVLASHSVADTNVLHLPDLTLPRSDLRTVRDLVNRHARELLRRLVSLPVGRLRPEFAPLHQGATRLYRDLLARDPRPLVRVLRQPTH